jgi:hypothetical protein
MVDSKLLEELKSIINDLRIKDREKFDDFLIKFNSASYCQGWRDCEKVKEIKK